MMKNITNPYLSKKYVLFFISIIDLGKSIWHYNKHFHSVYNNNLIINNYFTYLKGVRFSHAGPEGLVRGQPTILAGVRAAVRPTRSPLPPTQAVPGGRLPARTDAVPADGRGVQPRERHAGFRQLRRHTRWHVLRGRRDSFRFRPVPVRRQQPRTTAPVRSGAPNKWQ